MVADHLKAVKSIRHAASKPIEGIHLPFFLVIEKIQKAQEADSLLLSELEPVLLQELIQKSIYEFCPNSFVGIRQAVLYTIQYCSKTSFLRVKWLKIGKITLKNTAIKIQILKKQRCFICPIFLQNNGKLCPVSLIVCYLSVL